MPTATPAQIAVIRYYAGAIATTGLRGRSFSSPEEVCYRKGWLTSTDVFPYSAPTAAGREVAGLSPERPAPAVQEESDSQTVGTCGHPMSAEAQAAGEQVCKACQYPHPLTTPFPPVQGEPISDADAERIDAELTANAAAEHQHAEQRRTAALTAAEQPRETRTPDVYGIAVGDRVTGPCVSGGNTFTGIVAEIIPRGFGMTSNAYRLVATGVTGPSGPVEPVVYPAQLEPATLSRTA